MPYSVDEVDAHSYFVSVPYMFLYLLAAETARCTQITNVLENCRRETSLIIHNTNCRPFALVLHWQRQDPIRVIKPAGGLGVARLAMVVRRFLPVHISTTGTGDETLRNYCGFQISF